MTWCVLSAMCTPYLLILVLVLTDILGHNFGSTHDITADCVPSGSHGGKYLMYPYVGSGLDRNNKVIQFSFNSLCL